MNTNEGERLVASVIITFILKVVGLNEAKEGDYLCCKKWRIVRLKFRVGEMREGVLERDKIWLVK